MTDKNFKKMHKSDLSIFLELSDIPTTAFHENRVSDYIKNKLKEFEIDFEEDEWGNIEAFIKGQKKEEVVFVSHMDHPGFEIIEKLDENLYKAKTLGGLPKLSDVENTKIKIYDKFSENKGYLKPFNESSSNDSRYKSSDRWLNNEFVSVQVELKELNFPVPVVFDLPKPKISNDQIITPVADDLAGCALILEMLRSLKTSQNNYSIRGIFSRAEEVGLYGARLIAKSGRIDKNSIIVSIETSSELPGAVSGSGPIIRTGDRATTFDNSGEIILLSSVKQLIDQNKEFLFQRQLMSLGGCEATAFSAFGYKVTGISLPLINWHNANPEGKVESERISITDYQNALNIMIGVGNLDIVNNNDYYKTLIDIPAEAERLRLS